MPVRKRKLAGNEGNHANPLAAPAAAIQKIHTARINLTFRTINNSNQALNPTPLRH